MTERDISPCAPAPPAIAITGASGRVGHMLVPLLAARGCRLLLAGRDPEKLRLLFPGQPCCAEGDLALAARGFDLVLHLAALNNDVDAPAAAFMAANVEGALLAAQNARAAGVCALLLRIIRARARSAAERCLLGIETRSGKALVGSERNRRHHRASRRGPWRALHRRLALLNALPRLLRGPLFTAAASLRPTLHVERLADAVVAAAQRPSGAGHANLVLSDGQSGNIAYPGTAAVA